MGCVRAQLNFFPCKSKMFVHFKLTVGGGGGGAIAQGLICGAQALRWMASLAGPAEPRDSGTHWDETKETDSFCCFKSIFTVPGEQRQPTNTEINYEKFY